MSITYDHGDIVFQCDRKGCHATVETETSNFDSALNLLRRHRWKARKAGGEWKQYCPADQEGMR